MKKNDKNKIVNEIYFVFKGMYNSLNSDNWVNSFSFFIDQIIKTKYNVLHERIVTGWLAALSEKAYYEVAHQKKINERVKFENDFKKIIKSKKIPEFLTLSGPVLCGKRQPPFVESIGSTFDRYNVMENLGDLFNPGVRAIIIGGSMSYGAFYSVRNNEKDKDFSDIDGLVIVQDNFFDEGNKRDLFVNNKIFPESEIKQFFDRMTFFRKLYNQGKADVLSQRFSVIGKQYTVSLHFFIDSTFKKMMYTDLKYFLDKKVDTDYLLKDFRTDLFTHPCLARHTFNGGRYESVITGYKEKEGGYISNSTGFTISNGMYFPGIFHTVIYPSFLVFYDKDQYVTDLVKGFEKLLYDQVDILRKKFPSSTYAKAHNRYDIFAPGRFEEGLNSFISPDSLNQYRSDSDFTIISLGMEASVYSDIQNNEEENAKFRGKIQRKLKISKKKTLQEAEKNIKDFINSKYANELLSVSKKQGRKWLTVCLIKAVGKQVEKIPYPYFDINKKILIDSELYLQTISAREIMKLGQYEELSKKYGRVFVASIMDPSEEFKTHPIYFALIIKT